MRLIEIRRKVRVVVKAPGQPDIWHTYRSSRNVDVVVRLDEHGGSASVGDSPPPPKGKSEEDADAEWRASL